MWDEEALYFAFEVVDDKIIQKERGNDIWKGDHIEVWLEMDLEGDWGEAVNSDDDYQFGFSPGNFSDLSPEVYLWTPTLGIAYEKMIEVGASPTEKGYFLEARVPGEVLQAWQMGRVGVEPTNIEKLGFNLPSEEVSLFHSGLRFGIMVDGSDCDDLAVPQESLISTSSNRSWGDPTTFGVLALEKR